MTEFKTQEQFTKEINHLILEGKKQGYSTKNISDKWHTFGDLYYHRMIRFIWLWKNTQIKVGKLSNIMMAQCLMIRL